jgi:hypothetical protein
MGSEGSETALARGLYTFLGLGGLGSWGLRASLCTALGDACCDHFCPEGEVLWSPPATPPQAMSTCHRLAWLPAWPRRCRSASTSTATWSLCA